MAWKSPDDAMPWVGLYIAIASFICTLAMAADVVRSLLQWKLWFPNKFFTLNAFTITLIAIALKLPVDLSTKMSETETLMAKIGGIDFLVTMLANFLPSLGLMDDRELFMNTVALGILVITININVSIQLYTMVISPMLIERLVLILLLILCVLPFSVALTVSASRKKLEQRYKESQGMISSHENKMFSSKELRRYVKTYWMMTETRNPQFVIACSPVSSAFGVMCLLFAFPTSVIVSDEAESSKSEYKQSIKIIYIIQSIGVVVGSIAPVFRCITSIGHYSLSKKWSKNQLNIFRVEKHWIQMLQQWKHSHVHSYIPGRHCKIVFHIVKKTFLNFCIALHIVVLVVCKTISLIPRLFLLILSYCWYLFKSVLKRFEKVANASNSNSNVNSEIEEYTRYVVQIEEEAKLSNRIVRNTLHSITQVLDDSKKKEPRYLMMLLEKSTGFNGVLKFDTDEIRALYPEEIHKYCWSLVVVTLTATAIALPNAANGEIKGLIASMKEGLQIVRHVEECVNEDAGDMVEVRKSAKRVWTEIEIYHSWLQIDLQMKARKGKTSKDILKWLGDEAEKIMKEFKSNKKPSIDQSPFKFIIANSMYRISRTILLQYNEQQENLVNDEELVEWISTMIADILFACFTNLPRVIKMRCYHPSIEKRGDNIWNAAKLLCKSKKILKILKKRRIPNMDLDSMAYIDKWHALTMSQISNGGYGASSSGIQAAGSSSSANQSFRVTIK